MSSKKANHENSFTLKNYWVLGLDIGFYPKTHFLFFSYRKFNGVLGRDPNNLSFWVWVFELFQIIGVQIILNLNYPVRIEYDQDQIIQI